ncbi:stathmin domain-containing protein 1 [Trachemys scripta elegans]|uniref:stathmin domain-containing protein 1 n=1 Tax=Trachemys scripta elegans TaxID=31138 RepID=UPI0015552400|nr:stathmin domain-containing protein 1 [Trachemys scripta elegans]
MADYSSFMAREGGGHGLAMGCGSSSRIEVLQPSVKELPNGWGAKNQANNDPSQRAAGSTLRDGSTVSKGSGVKLEDELSGGNSPREGPERSPSPREKNNGQNTDIMLLSGGFVNKPMHLQERERQKSSDILEELMMQGIIKSQTTTFRNGEADAKLMDTLEKPLKKPPAKLEKLKIEKKEVNALTMKDIKNSAEERRKTKEEQPKERLQSGRLFPAIAHQNIAELNEEGYSTSEGQEGTNIVQPLSFDLETETLLEKEEIAVEIVNSNSEHFGAVESDTTYNTSLNEAF